ncbi:MAG: AI-2E family transporter [Gammaproteobacteria bacterium]|nr:AI-2E family transporter [Gammaproteobacteria bacterium]
MGDLKKWWWLGVILTFSWLVYLLSPILTPFLIAATFAYLGDPMADWLESKKLNRTGSVIIVFILFTLIGALFILMMIPMLKQQFELLSEKVPVAINYFKTTVYPWIKQHIGAQGQFDTAEIQQTLKEQLTGNTGLIAKVMSSISSSGMALFAWLGNLVLIPVVTFYLLRDWDIVTEKVTGLFPRHVEPVAKKLAKDCDEVLSAFVRGQLMVMVALGVIYAAGLYFVGLDLALLVGMIAGLASIVPYLGFIIGIVFAVIAGLIQFGDPSILIWIAIVFAIGQMLEGMVLTPLLVGDKIGLHPVAVIFAIMAGGQLFGFTGILIALPVAAVIMVLLRHAHDRYINSVLYGAVNPSDALSTIEVENDDEKGAKRKNKSQSSLLEQNVADEGDSIESSVKESAKAANASLESSGENVSSNDKADKD